MTELGNSGDGARPAPPDPGTSAWERIHDRIISYHAETNRIIAAQHVAGACCILDVACGTGRHLIEAARLGHHCVGIDQQEWKIERAKRDAAALGLAIDFSCRDMRTLEVEPVYDLVVCLYAMSIMTTDADLAALFATADRALRPTGSFVFNVLNKHAEVVSGSPTPAQQSAPGHLRDFALDEILGFAKRAGFASCDVEMFDVAGIKNMDIFICARRGADR
jgi:cyclopropane fatty-acyl-phospholipid synthase-like methyltransferase